MGAFISNVKKDGIKIKKSNLVIMILCCVLCCCILYSSFQIKTKYGEITYTMNDYSDCSKAVNNFNEACDFLTNQARLFVVEKDISFAKNYFREYSEFQNREKSIEVIEITHVNDSPDINMQMAYDESKYISENEIYAMTLVFESLNLDYSDYPTIIKSKMFTNEDTLLSAEEKSDKAQNLLFGSKYQSSKDRINKYTSAAMSDILQQYLTVEENDNNRFSKYLYIQFIIIITLLCVSILFFVLLYILVLKPLEYNIKSIREEKKMSVSGAYEMRLIAKTYNALREKNEIRASILKHKAEHDPLTGLINREAFTKIKEVMSDTSEAVAYLIIDIDFFKSINDRYGHLTGDEVLKKIAVILSEQFRDTDYVARIGGDEFSVIMTKFGETPELIIQRKIENINKMLQNIGDGLPAVSLSVGVAISSIGYNSILEEQADKALYKVKQGGRCNCSFYSIE